jgi:hypothetical protein
MSILYANVTGVSTPLNISVSMSHVSAVTTATIECISTTLGIGDDIEIDLGYSDNHAKIFTGYVKGIDHSIPTNTYLITAHDVLVRAIDFFVVSEDPENPFTRSNISAEDLIEDVLGLAGITGLDADPTNFVFATASEAEVNLVSAYDYCKYIADFLTYHIYADHNGTVHFLNRKPYVMVAGSPESSQPGFNADSSAGTIDDTKILTFTYKESEQDLRNRVVVYGSPGVYAEASDSSPYLPAGYYKSMAFATPLIDQNSYAQDAADYNLLLLNRLTRQISTTVIGDPSYLARRAFTMQESILSINDLYYTLIAEHSWSKSGYTVNMELRK